MSGLGHAQSAVMTLTDKYLNKGHVLYTNNDYTSVSLVNNFLENKTTLCETLR